MKTEKTQIQIGYLESVKTHKWLQKNVPKQGQSKFIREAVAAKIALDKGAKKSA